MTRTFEIIPFARLVNFGWLVAMVVCGGPHLAAQLQMVLVAVGFPRCPVDEVQRGAISPLVAAIFQSQAYPRYPRIAITELV